MTTIAKPTSNQAAHWYEPSTALPKHFVPKKDGSGDRPTTLADARKNGWVPSTTTILKLLHKQALVEWLIEQAVLTVITAPRLAGEADDAFIQRVLHTEKQHDAEAAVAQDKGTAIHDAIERAAKGEPYNPEFGIYVSPTLDEIQKLGRVVATEKIVIGRGYGGKFDLTCEDDAWITIVDFKSAKKLPEKGSWSEHVMQTASYAKALGNTGDKRIRTANIYISTQEPGKVITHVQEDWETAWRKFDLLVEYWYLEVGLVRPGNSTDPSWLKD